jgi:hypothetical protein
MISKGKGKKDRGTPWAPYATIPNQFLSARKKFPFLLERKIDWAYSPENISENKVGSFSFLSQLACGPRAEEK